MSKVLIVATSRKTRGGITSVVKAHETGKQWNKYHCKWIETHRDGPSWRKILYFIKAYLQFFCLIPFYDLVHIHVASYSSLKRKKHFLSLAKFWHKKTIAHFHPHKPEVIFEKNTQKEYIHFFKSVNRIVVLSPQWQRWIKESLNITENIQVIYNPCPIVNRSNVDRSKKYILFAGTLYHRKGFDTLIKAFGKIANEYKNWKIILAGNPKEEKDKELMSKLPKQLNIEKQIEYPGWVVGEQKEELFKNASIFCLASSAEGFPMAVLDAWAYGVPVICTPVGGLPDIVRNEENALIFDYGDVDTLAVQLKKLINNKALWKKIEEQSILLAQTTFNINNINNQVEELYKSVLNE
ncbi:glycosyltransferase family 4 protein [Bacteroides clarus]|uniref:Glycosyl transferase family 1 n=1 Tax=Bacteroides clarus TaxID=626929 RepID=A0A1Y3YQ12_9BACE|nr:glycosyltransferase family 4 protein [Bacteroides clarus]OUN99904.1 glycosyl transferase family 1 [Bacteroides clarus]